MMNRNDLKGQLLVLWILTAAWSVTGCSQSISSIADSIKPGTPISDIESRFGKADQVIDAQARKGKSENKLHVYKKIDDEFDLWVTVGSDGKVVWATPQSKAAKVNPG